MSRVLILVLGLMFGCATAPERPSVIVAKQWSVAPPSAAPGATLERGPSMWDRFGSAELKALLGGAKANFDYVSAEANAAQREALARIASAPLYPALSFETSLSGQSANGRTLESVRGAFFEAGLVASYEIDVWGKNRQRSIAAERTRDESRHAKDETALRVRAGVARAYFEVVSLRERITHGRVNLELTERMLAVVESRERAGAALAREVAQQRALVAAERVRVEQLALAEAQARVDLALVSGREPNGVEVQASSFDTVEEPVFSATDLQTPEALLKRRPDVAAAEAALAATHADVTAARRALLPELRVVGQAAFQQAFLTKFTDPTSDESYSEDGSQFVYSGALVLSQPIFDGGAISAESDAAAARRAQATANYQRVAFQAVAEVERALQASRSLREQYDRQRVVVDEARRALELLEIEYKAGAGDIVGVLDAQRTLFRAEDDLSQFRVAKLRAAVAMIEALGVVPSG